MKANCIVFGCLMVVAGLLAGCGRQPGSLGPESEAKGADATDSVASIQDASPAKLQSEFPFPSDRGGRLLADNLRPANQVPTLPADAATHPKRLSGPKQVENPDLPLPAIVVPPPSSIPNPKTKPIRPTLVDSEPPLSRQRLDLAGPPAVNLPAGPKVAWPSPDVNQPIPLPILARQVVDRASLDDPSADASLAAALAPTVPDRTTPAPFLKLTLPDPFEHRNAVRLRTEVPVSLPNESRRLPQH
jgi:hypothetical protein